MIVKDGILIKVEQPDIKDKQLLIPCNIKTINSNAINENLNLTTIICADHQKFKPNSINNSKIKHIIISHLTEDYNKYMFSAQSFGILTRPQRINIHNPNFDWRDAKYNRWLINIAPITIEDSTGVHKIFTAKDKILEATSRYIVYDIYQVAKCNIIDEDEQYYFMASKQGIQGYGIGMKAAIKDCYDNYVEYHNLDKKYHDITLQTLLTPEQYQEITGACKSGIKQWIDQNNNLLEHFDNMLSVEYLLNHLKGQPSYTDFVQFINDRYGDRVNKDFDENIRRWRGNS